jgi:hypothetical protein
MFDYFAEISAGRMILWNYLLWYLAVAFQYFDPSPRLWMNSLGISLVVGVALVLSTTASWRAAIKSNPWQVIRLFILPFCSSSFAALIKDRGFLLILSPRLSENLPGFALCVCFSFLVLAVKQTHRRQIPAVAPTRE